MKKVLQHQVPSYITIKYLGYTFVTIALWGFLQLKSELIRKAETLKIREKQTNMALFLKKKSLNNLKNDE